MLSGVLGFFSISFAEEGKWTKKADMPTARCCLSTSVVNGKIYAIGGVQPWPTPISTVEEYDAATDTWTKKADMPTARTGFSTSVVNGKIYAIGGASGPDTPLSTVEEYDPQTDTWRRRKKMPTARAYFSTSTVRGKIYAIGGWGGWGNDLSTVEEYNPVTDTWRRKKQMPTARNGFSTSVVNESIYAFGGSVGGGVAPLQFLSTVEVYDPQTDIWRKKKKMPISGPLDTITVNGKIYVIDVANWTVEEYNPQTDTWTMKAEMPPPRRWGFSISAVNGKIYVIGGGLHGDIMTSIVEAYDTGLGIEAKGKLATSWGKLKAED